MVRPLIRLYTTTQAFDELHDQLEQRRGKRAKVDAQIVLGLLMDHSALLECVCRHGYVADGKSVARVKTKRGGRVRMNEAIQ